MRKIKKFLCFMIFVIIINFSSLVYADDESEEKNVTVEEIEYILETVSEIEDIPTINSRNAVVYDRTSRSSNIWKRRK